MEGGKGVRETRLPQPGVPCRRQTLPGSPGSLSSAFSGTHIIHPGDVSRDSREDCGLPRDVTAQAGHKAGHSMDRVLVIHQAVEGTSRVTLSERATEF